MSNLMKNIIRFILFLGVQVYVFDNIPPLHRFVVPVVYFLFILWLPFSVPRFWLLLIGFLTGLTLDYFTVTPGLHAAACVLIAYLRPFLINLLIRKDADEFNFAEPSARAMGWAPYSLYAFILTLAHHGYLLFLEWLDAGNFLDFIIKVIATSAVSMLLILTAEVLFPRASRYRPA